jgi:SAM-dependent methyltransferase
MGGRRQTRVFAEHFLRHAALPRDEAFALLDVGCALGDALELFASTFPKAKLQGLDFSATAISRARQSLGDKVELRQGDIEDVHGHFDVIYCSNTLEHFADFDRKARGLVQHCKRLFIMVPLHELRAGQPLRPDPSEHHQHTFERDSFDFLVREGLASRIQMSIFACPGAWGWSPAAHAVQFVKNLARTALGRDWLAAPRQILYNIEAVDAASAMRR